MYYKDIGSLFSSEDMHLDDGYLRLNLLNCPNTSTLQVHEYSTVHTVYSTYNTVYMDIVIMITLDSSCLK